MIRGSVYFVRSGKTGINAATTFQSLCEGSSNMSAALDQNWKANDMKAKKSFRQILKLLAEYNGLL